MNSLPANCRSIWRISLKPRIISARIFTAAYSTESTDDANLRHQSFQHRDLLIERTCDSKLRIKAANDTMRFGTTFSDHMLEIEWTLSDGWNRPKILPFHDLVLHPAAKVLHYSTELFEGLKAYRGVDNKIRMFRPMLNMERMVSSANRSCLPEFDTLELFKCIKELVHLEKDWVPASDNSSLYIRPTMIGTDPTLGVAQANRALLFVIVGPVSAFFTTGFKPIGLYADTDAVRSWPGGAGQFKLGSNYGPTIYTNKKAQERGCQQVLWLFSRQHFITEVGTMNIFVYWRNKEGENELVTPNLDTGLILPGITRRCILELAREWKDFKVSERAVKMNEVTEALREKRVFEIFGSGTACTVTPVDRIVYREEGVLNDYYVPTIENSPSLFERFSTHINAIQYGRISRPEWTHTVC